MRCLCGLFGRSKQAFYKHDEDALLSRAARSEFVVDYVLSIRRKDPGIGGLKLWHMYKKAFSGNAPVGRDAFMTILSDRGCQYASREYVSELRRHGISISMTECGDPKENAQAERVNGTMKNELLKGMVFRDIAQARSAIGRAVEFYNKERPNMSIDMMTPSEAAARTGEIKKRWTSYRLAAIKSKQEGLIVPENSLPLQQSRPAAGIPAAQ